MDVKFLVILVYNALFFGYGFAQNSGNCQIEALSSTAWSSYLLALKDNQINEEIFSSVYNGSLSVTSVDPSGTNSPDVSMFLEVTSNDTHFVIKTKQEMENFDKSMEKTQGNIRTQLAVKMECEGGTSTLNLLLQIEDVNDYDPEFQNEAYLFEVASPLMPPTDFSVYGSLVIATDWDFSNQDVTFTITPDDFDITTSKTDTSKDYTAIFSAKRILQLTEDTVYILTATDSGSPNRSSSVNITLTPDASLSLDKPTFTSSSYAFNYTLVEDQPVLTPLEGQITLQSNRLGDTPQFTLSGDSSTSFEVPTVDSTTGIVELKLKEALTSTSSIIALTLTVETDNPAVTNIVINLPEVSLLFDKHVYTGNYDAEAKTVTLDEEIGVVAVGLSGSPQVEFSGDFSNNFELIPGDNKMYLVNVKAELTGDELRKLPIGLKMTATIDDETDVAYLNLRSTVKSFRFLKSHYYANYSTDDGTIVLSAPIQFTEQLGDVTATVDDDASSYFDITCDKSSQTCTISKQEPLPQNVLDAQTEIAITITALDGYDNSAETVLTVSIPQGPKFEKSLYNATYQEDGESFDFDEELKFVNEEDPSSIEVILDSYEYNLKVTYEDNWKIKILHPLNVTGTSLAITMSATKTGAVNSGKSVLNLQLPDDTKETLIFSKAYYLVTYQEEDDILYFVPSIGFENADLDSVQLSISGDYDNFHADKQNNKWQIDVNSPLNRSVIEANNELVMTIIAEDQDGNTGTSVLVIDLPTLQRPKFSQTYYTGTYQDGKVALYDTITVESIDEIVNIVVEERFTNNFEVIPSDSATYNLNVTNPLADLTGDEIIIGLTATDSVGSATSTLVLTLVKKVAPEFSQTHYLATYDNETGHITLNESITVVNKEDLNSVEVVLEKEAYSTNFKLNRGENDWTLDVASQPDTDDSVFVFTLKATENDNENYGEAILVIQIPSRTPKDPPTFNQTYYKGQYLRSSDIDTVILDAGIEVISQDPDSVEVNTENLDDNFEIKFDTATNECEVKVKSNVDDDTIKATKELIIGLVVSDQYGTGTSTLVLQLPQYEAPEFSRPSYKVTYTNETDLVVDYPITIINKELSDVEIIVEETTYDTNFDVTFNSSKSSWDFEVSSLPESVEYPLVLTLKASDTSSGAYSEATLILDVNSQENSIAPIFSKTYYIAIYEGSNVTSEQILITNKDPSTLQLELDSYDPNFSFVLDPSTKEWSMRFETALPDDVIDDKNELVMTIIARESGNVNVGQATLIMRLPLTNVSWDALAFNEVHYDAEYDTSGETAVVRLAENITVSWNNLVTDLPLELEPDDSYFSLEPTDSGYSIKVENEIPEEVLKAQNSLVYTIKATSDAKEASATLVVHLPVTLADDPIKFANVLYEGTYEEKDDKAELKVEDILIDTELGNDDYTVEIDEASTYKNYFTVTHSNKVVSIALSEDKIPDLDVNFLALTLIAKATDSTAQSSAVLNIEITRDDNSPVEEFSFGEPLYNAQYFAVNSSWIVDPIQIVSGRSNGEIEVSIVPDNDEFDKEISGSNVLTLKLKEGKSLPDSDFVTYVVTATVTADTTLNASTALIVQIEKSDDSIYVEFQSIINTGTYRVTDNVVTVDVDPISLTTDQEDENIEVTITNDYTDYFTLGYANNLVTVTSNAPIPTETLTALTSVLFTIEASIYDTTLKSQTVVSLDIIRDTQDTSTIRFEKILHTAQYNIIDSKGDLEIGDPITVETSEDDSQIFTSITDDGSGFSTYFTPSYSNNEFTVTLEEDLPEDALEHSFIALTLIATIGDGGNSEARTYASAVLTVEIVKSDDNSTGILAFPSIINTGTYRVTDNVVTVDVDPISLTTDQEDENIDVTITNDYTDYFNLGYANNLVTVTYKASIPTETLTALTSVLFTIEASIKDTTLKSQTVVSLDVIRDTQDTSTIRFEKILHTAQYNIIDSKGDLEIGDPITVETSEEDSQIFTSITDDGNEFSAYFTPSYSNNEFTVTLKEDLPEDALEHSFIGLTLIATIGDGGDSEARTYASAVLTVEIVQTVVATGKLSFTNAITSGTYEVVDGVATLDLDDIPLETDQSEEDIDIVMDGDYTTFFTPTYADGKVTIEKGEAIISYQSSIVFTITASTKDGSLSSETVVDLQFIGGEVFFDNHLYSVEYSEKDSSLSDIELKISTESKNTIEIDIDNDFGLDQYFTASVTDKVATLSLRPAYLPSDVIDSYSVIPLLVTASIGINSVSSVVNVMIIKSDDNSTGILAFPSIINTGTYRVTDNVVTVDVDPISLTTDQEDENIDVTITNDYTDYFNLGYANNLVTVTYKASIPTETLTALTSVLFTIEASIKDTTLKSQTVVSLDVIRDTQDTSTIRFEKILHTAQYNIIDGKGNLEIGGTITIETSEEDSQISTSITDEGNGFSTYFTPSYSNNEFIVTLKEDLPEDALEHSFIALTLIATIGDGGNTEARTYASAVLTVEIVQTDVPTGKLNFPNIITSGIYEVVNDEATMKLDGIPLETDQSGDSIDVVIDEDYQDYFKPSYADGNVTIETDKVIPSSMLATLTSIVFTVTASTKDGALSSKTVVQLGIIENGGGINGTSTIWFDKVLHNAEYKVSDGKATFEVKDTITVLTSEEDGQISTSISDDGNGFSKYFTSSYSNNEFTVTLTESLPDNALKYSFIALTLTAEIIEDSRAIPARTYASAVLNVEIDGGGSNTDNDDDNGDNDHFNKTPWIVAIAVLASLLALLLAGAIAFYFFKLRRKDYTDVDDELWKVRFAGTEKKKKHTKGLTPVEARRPTAFEFNQLEEDEQDPNETSTDQERRKSVLFDDNVEKLEIDKVDEEDDFGEKKSEGEAKTA